jgi:hypothetical protein
VARASASYEGQQSGAAEIRDGCRSTLSEVTVTLAPFKTYNGIV